MRDFYRWRDSVVRQMRFKPDRAIVAEELTAHYEDHVKDLERLGYDRSLAESRALDAMGDAEEIGRALDKAHRPWLGWLWLVSRWGVIACAVLIAFFCSTGSFAGLKDGLTPVRREGDYEPEGLHTAGEGSLEREDSVRIALGHGTSTVERAGYTLSVPYAAAWEQPLISGNTGGPCVQYWYTIVVAADDRRFWDASPAALRRRRDAAPRKKHGLYRMGKLFALVKEERYEDRQELDVGQYDAAGAVPALPGGDVRLPDDHGAGPALRPHL
nr:permease prefix domain 1-containing protein [uncultured Oscillibacter sp.]